MLKEVPNTEIHEYKIKNDDVEVVFYITTRERIENVRLPLWASCHSRILHLPVVSKVSIRIFLHVFL